MHGPCSAQALREARTNKSALAKQALRHLQLLYEMKTGILDTGPDLRRRIQQE